MNPPRNAPRRRLVTRRRPGKRRTCFHLETVLGPLASVLLAAAAVLTHEPECPTRNREYREQTGPCERSGNLHQASEGRAGETDQPGEKSRHHGGRGYLQ